MGLRKKMMDRCFVGKNEVPMELLENEMKKMESENVETVRIHVENCGGWNYNAFLTNKDERVPVLLYLMGRNRFDLGLSKSGLLDESDSFSVWLKCHETFGVTCAFIDEKDALRSIRNDKNGENKIVECVVKN